MSTFRNHVCHAPRRLATALGLPIISLINHNRRRGYAPHYRAGTEADDQEGSLSICDSRNKLRANPLSLEREREILESPLPCSTETRALKLGERVCFIRAGEEEASLMVAVFT